MSDWPELSIDELKASTKNSIAMGPFGSRIKAESFVKSGVPIIKGGNLNGDFILENKFEFLTEEKATELRTSNAFRRDIVITHRGTIGQVGIIPDNSKFERYVVSQSQLKVTLDQEKVNPYFVYYFLRSPLGQHRLLLNASQVGVPAIAQASTSVKGIMVPCPDKEIQDRVVEIFLSLDHKIELNQQTNKTLEQIAQAIFKNWFVDFEPVKAKIIAKEKGGDELAQSLAAQAVICGAITLEQLQNLENDYRGLEAQLHPLITNKFPNEIGGLDYWSPKILQKVADLFPGNLVESEIGEIPDGWDANPLGQYLEIKRGGSPRPIKEYIVEKGLPWTKIADATKEPSPFLFRTKECIKEEGLKKTILLKKGSLILSNSATPGMPKFLELDACIHDGWLHFPQKRLFSDLYLFQLFLEIKKELIAQGNGSVFTNLKTDILRNQVVVAPEKEIISVFDKSVSLIFEKVKENCKEINVLTSLKDSLLPKLLSGETIIGKAQSSAEAEA